MKTVILVVFTGGCLAFLGNTIGTLGFANDTPPDQLQPATAKCCGGNGEATNTATKTLAHKCVCAMYPFYADPYDPDNILYYCEITYPSVSCDVTDVAYAWSSPLDAPLYCDLMGMVMNCPDCEDFSYVEKTLTDFGGMDHQHAASLSAAHTVPYNLKHPRGNDTSHPNLGIVSEESVIVSYVIPEQRKTVYIKLYDIRLKLSRTNFPRRAGAHYPEDGTIRPIHIGYEINPDLDGDGLVEEAERDLLAPRTHLTVRAAERYTGNKAAPAKLVGTPEAGRFVKVITYEGVNYLVALAKPLPL